MTNENETFQRERTEVDVVYSFFKKTFGGYRLNIFLNLRSFRYNSLAPILQGSRLVRASVSRFSSAIIFRNTDAPYRAPPAEFGAHNPSK